MDLLHDEDCEREVSSFELHHGLYSCVSNLVQPLFVCSRQIYEALEKLRVDFLQNKCEREIEEKTQKTPKPKISAWD